MDHEGAEVGGVDDGVGGHLDGDTLVSAQPGIFLGEGQPQRRVRGIDDGDLAQVEADPPVGLFDRRPVTEEDELGDPALADLTGRFEDPRLGAFGQDDPCLGRPGIVDQLVLEHQGVTTPGRVGSSSAARTDDVARRFPSTWMAVSILRVESGPIRPAARLSARAVCMVPVSQATIGSATSMPSIRRSTWGRGGTRR